MTAGGRSALVVAGLAALSAAWVWAGVGGPLRPVFALALVFVLPGAALLLALGIRLAPRDALLAGAIASIAITVLAGLAIGGAHGGFAGRTVTSVLAASTVAMCVLAALRSVTQERAPEREGQSARPAARAPAAAEDRARRMLSAGLYTAATAVAAAAIFAAHRSAVDHARSAAFAQLWQAPAPAGAGAAAGAVAERIGPGARRYELALAGPDGRTLERLELELGPGHAGAAAATVPAGGHASLTAAGAPASAALEVGAPPARRSPAAKAAKRRVKRGARR